MRLKGQVRAIESLSHIAGYCYTQLTDVEQEENGFYTYDRSEKFDMRRIREIFSGRKTMKTRPAPNFRPLPSRLPDCFVVSRKGRVVRSTLHPRTASVYDEGVV